MKSVTKKAVRKKASRKKVARKKVARKKAASRRAVPNALVDGAMLPEEPTEPPAPPSVEFSNNYGTSQIYDLGFEFAFAAWDKAKKLYRQACTFVYCKDFLHDAVWAHVNQQPWTIWLFKYDPAKDVPLDDDNCVFLFRNTEYQGSDGQLHDNLAACQQFLNGVEAKLGFEPSQIHKVPHKDGPCWLVVGDKGWQHAPPMVGLYTLFIRLGVFHKLGDSVETTLERAVSGDIKIGDDENYAGNRDAGYVRRSKKGIDVILKHGLEVFHPEKKDNYPPSLKNHRLHDEFGPVNFTRAASCNGSAKQAMPFWYRNEVWG